MAMRHIERHHSKHTPAQLFDLVADVDRYPEFVPGVIDAKVMGRQDSTVWVEMTMGTGFLCKRFTTVALLERPQRIEIKNQDPIFDRFEQVGMDIRARIREAAPILNTELMSNSNRAFCRRSLGIIRSASKNAGEAFTRRARRLYGAAPSASHN